MANWCIASVHSRADRLQSAVTFLSASQINRYAYVYDSPVTYTNPGGFGTCAFTVGDLSSFRDGVDSNLLLPLVCVHPPSNPPNLSPPSIAFSPFSIDFGPSSIDGFGGTGQNQQSRERQSKKCAAC